MNWQVVFSILAGFCFCSALGILAVTTTLDNFKPEWWMGIAITWLVIILGALLAGYSYSFR